MVVCQFLSITCWKKYLMTYWRAALPQEKGVVWSVP